MYDDNDLDSLINDLALDDIDDLADSLVVDYSKNVYIICERKSFRADSFHNMMAKDYHTVLLFAATDSLYRFEDPLCFVVEVSSTENAIPIKTLKHIEDCAIQANVPLFLIGERNDLKKTDQIFRMSNAYIRKFARPYNLADVTAEISSVLVAKPYKNRKKRIMIVDDSITFLRIVKKALENKYSIIPVTSALNCIKLLAGMPAPPDMIIIDYMMPTCNGEILCRMLREDSFVKDVPMVFYSSNENVKEIIPLMPIIDGYMLKNMSMENVENYIEDVFRHKMMEIWMDRE